MPSEKFTDQEVDDFFEVLSGRRKTGPRDARILQQAAAIRRVTYDALIDDFVAAANASEPLTADVIKGTSTESDRIIAQLNSLGLLDAKAVSEAEPVAASPANSQTDSATNPVVASGRAAKPRLSILQTLLAWIKPARGASWQMPAGAMAVMTLATVISVVQMKEAERGEDEAMGGGRGAGEIFFYSKLPSARCEQVKMAIQTAGASSVQITVMDERPDSACVVIASATEPKAIAAVVAALKNIDLEVAPAQTFSVTVKPRSGMRRLLDWLPGAQ